MNRTACTFRGLWAPLGVFQDAVNHAGQSNLFKPVRISDNWCWHYAFTRINICHRIGANDLAILRHDARLLAIQVEPFGADACPTTHPAAIPETAPLN
ncbi:hypothetical protein ACOI9X_01825 [Pseudomonas sp. P2757]|uniref:hypothetical protein n=1 Tax=unclassified Pseudomonas TaxID=196821 RepID=UPI003B5B9ADF